MFRDTRKLCAIPTYADVFITYNSLLALVLKNRRWLGKVIKKLLRCLGKELQYFVMESKNFFSEPVSKNIELISKEKISAKKDGGKVPLITTSTNRPLAVLFEWISADKKPFYKYASLYLDRGYDVLAISLSVRNLLWPVSGSQVTASETCEFLTKNTSYDPLLVHGFSIGGYVWGEVLVKMAEDPEKYQPIINKVKGQIWDSTPDITEFIKGFPKAVFPNNDLLRFAVEKSIVYHLRIFHNSATKHYYNASAHFRCSPVKTPSLFFIAKNDLVASYNTILQVKAEWETQGKQVYIKSWENSKHVGHLRLHEEEYISALDDFLAILDENQNKEKESEKMQAKL